ncbi:MAG: class I SAM-dependent methyltransferase [Betaproteobacteria bacterium]|nr:class I SAM-dependent methyltransferase [Betaproteobacteria bacterium]
MKSVIRSALVILGLSIAALSATAQQRPSEGFTPRVGQAGKDVIWVPTPDDLVERMLRMAQVTAKDFVVDLGSGDGRIAIAAAKKFQARSQGIEFNLDMVVLSNSNAAREGVAGSVRFVNGDIFKEDFRQATVVTMYLLPSLNVKLRPTLLEMKPGTRLVAHQFDMDDWTPDEIDDIDGRRANLWIVPAKVDGSWRITLPGGSVQEMTLTQRYQMINGNVRYGKLGVGLRQPLLRGDQIGFSVMSVEGNLLEFTGQVSGNGMEGTVRSGQTTERWSARRS